MPSYGVIFERKRDSNEDKNKFALFYRRHTDNLKISISSKGNERRSDLYAWRSNRNSCSATSNAARNDNLGANDRLNGDNAISTILWTTSSEELSSLLTVRPYRGENSAGQRCRQRADDVFSNCRCYVSSYMSSRYWGLICSRFAPEKKKKREPTSLLWKLILKRGSVNIITQSQ